MTQRYLKNMKSGRVLPFTELLAKRPDMLECNKKGDVFANQPHSVGASLDDLNAANARIAVLQNQLSEQGPQLVTLSQENERLAAENAQLLDSLERMTAVNGELVSALKDAGYEEADIEALTSAEGTDETGGGADGTKTDEEIDRFSKPECEAYILEKAGKDIDKRKSLDALRDACKLARDGKEIPAELLVTG